MKTKVFNRNLIGLLILALILSACATASSNAPEELGGRVWVLRSMAGKPVLPGAQVTLEFNFDESSIGGNASCNSYFGGFKIRGQELTISETGSTMMACAEQERMQQESDYLQALSTVATYEIVNGELHLLTSDGQALIFSAK